MKRTRPASISRLLSPVNRVVFVALATLVLAATAAVDVGCSPSRERLVRQGRANAPIPAQVASRPASPGDGEASSTPTNRQRRSSTAGRQSRNAGWGSVLSVSTSTSLETRATRNRWTAERRDEIAGVAARSAVAEDNEPVDAVAENETMEWTVDEAADEVDDESEEVLVDADADGDAVGIPTVDSSDLEIVDLEADNLETDEEVADEAEGWDDDEVFDDDAADTEESEGTLEDDDEEMEEDTDEDTEEELEDDDDQAAGRDGEDENAIAEGGVEQAAAEPEVDDEVDAGAERGGPFDVMKRAVGLGTSDSDDNDDNDAEKKSKDTVTKDAGTKKPGAEKPPAEKPSTSTSKGTPTDTEAKPKPETDPHNGKKPSFEEIFKKTRAAEREHRGEAAKLLDEAKTLLGHRDYDRARQRALKAKQLDPSRDAEVEKLIQSIIRAQVRASRPRESRSR